MVKTISIEEVVNDSFLFISYSHDEKEKVEAWVNFLFEQGVRFFWDGAFRGGMDWETAAKKMLAHENCCGLLFFGSESAIESENVAKEWRAAAKTKQGRADGAFYSQIIMVTDDPSFDYKAMVKVVKTNEDIYDDEDFDDFRNLFGQKDHLYYTASKEDDKQALMQTIKVQTPQVVDEHELAREKLADISNLSKEITLKLGIYNGKPIWWRNICYAGDDAVLLCRDVLEEDFGGSRLVEWLEKFVRESFSEKEQEKLKGKVRLLTATEAEDITQEELANEKIWWLAETDGNLQSVIREDGSIYKRGYNNRLYKKGIRPVIALDTVVLRSIFEK